MLRMVMLRMMLGMMRCRVMMLKVTRWRMMMLRRRKMMILRMLMWRRRTDPKTAPHVLREPAQSKCTSTFHKSHFIRKSADPCRQQGERVRGGLTSNKMPEGAKSLCRTKAGSRRTRAGWQLAVQKRRKSQGLELVSSRFRK